MFLVRPGKTLWCPHDGGGVVQLIVSKLFITSVVRNQYSDIQAKGVAIVQIGD
jgi:hypothetical protein